MIMLNPPHPGSILKNDILPKLGISQEESAKLLGVKRCTLSRVINGKASISISMALSLETWLSNPSAEDWLLMQAKYDLSIERQKDKHNIKPIAKSLRNEKELKDLSENEKLCTDFTVLDKADTVQIKNSGTTISYGHALLGNYPRFSLNIPFEEPVFPVIDHDEVKQTKELGKRFR